MHIISKARMVNPSKCKTGMTDELGMECAKDNHCMYPKSGSSLSKKEQMQGSLGHCML